MTPTVIRTLAAVELPPTVDTEGACKIIKELEGQRPSEETVRRWPIEYRLVGRVRRYEVDRVIAHVRQRYEQAPVNSPPAPTPSGCGPRKSGPKPLKEPPPAYRLVQRRDGSFNVLASDDRGNADQLNRGCSNTRE